MTSEGNKLHEKILAAGGFGGAGDIFPFPIPRIEVWKIISDAAPAQEREPFYEAVKGYMLSDYWEQDPNLWPSALYETAGDLPGISQEEALAICHQFLSIEERMGRMGELIYLLHWDVLAAFYCPLRERYSVLRQMVGDGLLREAASVQEDTRSRLKWPLMITEPGKHGIRKALWRHRLRNRFLSGVEVVLDGLWQNFPRIITFLAAALGGGILLKLVEWLIE